MNLDEVKHTIKIFVKWVLLSLLVGVVVGPVGAAFGIILDEVTLLRSQFPWLLWLLPVAGVITVAAYQFSDLPYGGSTNAVFVAVREKKALPFRTAPLIFLATVLTHLTGGSAGREGAALQLGGSIAGSLGSKLGLRHKDIRVITLCGMSAAFSAIFGTPLAAAIFSLEVVNVGMMHYAALVPCLISAFLGVWIAGLMGLSPTAFALAEPVALSPLSMIQCCILGVLIALLSICFCQLLHTAPKLYAKYLKNPYLRILAGSFLIIGLTFLLGTTDYNGAGGHVIAQALDGQAVPWAFVLKMLFTALTLGCGFKGGEIVPVFFTGATFGCVIAPLLGLPASFGAALGMVSLFCGVTNAPLSSIFLAIELFGGQSIPLFALVCAVSYMLSGYFGLYNEQKILYSKLRTKFIDQKAH